MLKKHEIVELCVTYACRRYNLKDWRPLSRPFPSGKRTDLWNRRFKARVLSIAGIKTIINCSFFNACEYFLISNKFDVNADHMSLMELDEDYRTKFNQLIKYYEKKRKKRLAEEGYGFSNLLDQFKDFRCGERGGVDIVYGGYEASSKIA